MEVLTYRLRKYYFVQNFFQGLKFLLFVLEGSWCRSHFELQFPFRCNIFNILKQELTWQLNEDAFLYILHVFCGVLHVEFRFFNEEKQ